MIDVIDKVIKAHIESLVKIKGKSLPVFSIATADADDQPFTQAGLANKKSDRIKLPFLTLIRLPNIDVTDDNVTKRVHNYTGYKLFKDSNEVLTYYRASLHYVVTLFAENRKVSEDIMTSLYLSLRNSCLVTATIQLPIKDPNDETKMVAVKMDSDIIMGSSIEQVNPQDLSKAQIYKCRITFDLQNVNIYNFAEVVPGKLRVTIVPQDESGKKGDISVIIK